MKNKKCNVNVDLNSLPHLRGYGGARIDWKNSVGVSISFTSDILSGILTVLDNDGCKVLIRRDVDGFNTGHKEVWVSKNVLLNGDFTRSIFNEVAFTRPDLLKYFVDKNDALSFVKTDQQQINFKCPQCGFIKSNALATIASHGFVCYKCSSRSIGYPNKFMISLLNQLHCNYATEVNRSRLGFEWLENYRFDFLLDHNQTRYFIEMDGHFHFNDNNMNGRTAEESRAIDMYKDKIAKEHGYKVIRIDCNYKGVENRFTYIKNSVGTSPLINILNIAPDSIDWKSCDKDALSNLLHTICQYWNDGIRHAKTIAKLLDRSWSCIHTNLKKGAEIGLCDYDPRQASMDALEKQCRDKRQPIRVLMDDHVVGVFPSLNALSRQSMNLFGVFFNPGHLSYSHRTGSLCHGYTIQDITREEYERLLPQFQTIQN